jgi:alkylation response protein AidB-like acyl-CoA dehydrogenase
MDFELTPPQTRALETAREVANELAPGAGDRDALGEFPLAELARLADAGLMGVNVAANLGGMDAGVVAYSLAVTEIAAVDPAIAVTMCVNNMVAEVIAAFATESRKEELVPKLQSGVFNSGSFCLSEPGAGSDPQGMTTRATRSDGGWRISGSKAWITSGAHAGIYVVWAKTDDRISAFLVDPTSEGVSWGKPEEKMGQHASNTVAVSFDDVVVPEDNLLGDVGQGFKIAMMALDGGRIGIASQSLGIARGALEHAGDAMSPERYGELRAEYDAARLLALRAAWLKDTGEHRFTREASMAKMYASELATRACDAAMDALGVEGFGAPNPVERLRRDARVTRIYEGTNEIQRIVIAREVLRHGVFGSTI